MANLVEFLVKIRDLASGQMRSLATNSEGAFNRITSRMNSVGRSADQLNTRIDQLTRTRDISIDGRQIRRINSELTELERRRDRITNPGGGGMGILGKSLVFGAIGAAVALGGKTLQAGMDRQMAGTSFNVMAGEKDGAKLHKNLMGFATDTIYGNEVFGEAKTMLGFGVAAKNVMPAMKMLGDIAMGDAEHMKSLSLAFSQTASAGRLTGQDLLQYVDAGFNPLQAISEKTGISMAKLKKEVEKGKISFQDVAGAMEYSTGPMGRFHDGMKKMGEKPTGKWMAFKGAMETLSGTIGMALLPALGGLVDFFNWMGAHESIMYGIAAGIGAMTVAWALYTGWTQRAAIWQGILAVIAFWPIAVIGILVGAVVWVVKAFDGWGKSIGGLWGVIKAFTMMAGIGFKDFFQEIVFWGEWLWLKIKSIFEYIGGMITNVMNAMKLALSGDFSGAGKALTMEIKTDAGTEIEKLKNARAGERTANMLALDENKRQAAKSWNQVGLTKHKAAPGEKSGASLMDSKLEFKGAAGGGGLGSGASDTAKGISGGGVRNLTINIAKQGVDSITIHATTLTEGVSQIRETFIEMFNQVINSGNAAVSTN